VELCVKPPRFEYACPTTLDEALQLIETDDAKLLAGGQTLVPILNFRLAAPALLVDINRVKGLDAVHVSAVGLHIGAMVRWRTLERSPVVAAANPLLRQAVRHIAHYQIRNRGTVGGSCAHADPAAEFPAVSVLCEAEFVIQRRGRSRVLRADQFFLGPLTTALESHEILTEIRFPPWPAERRAAFDEVSPRQGDFAIAGAAVFVDCDAAGICHKAGIVVFGATDRPRRIPHAEALLVGRRIEGAILADAARIASEGLETHSDIHASAGYRREVTLVLIERSLARAAGEGARP
jgi:carbon-monoxide dehydrogenase medium subunit